MATVTNQDDQKQLDGNESQVSKVTKEPYDVDSIKGNFEASGRSSLRMTNPINAKDIVMKDNATLYITNAQSVTNVWARHNSAVFLVAENVDSMHMSDSATVWSGGRFYDEVIASEGVVIYRQALEPAYSNGEGACLQCRLAGERCSPWPKSLLHGEQCMRCKDFDRFCAVSEAWSAKYSVAKSWFATRRSRPPTIAMVSLPPVRPITPNGSCRGLRLAGTGYGFVHERESRLNQFKLKLEKLVGSQILWWPLAEPLRYEDVHDTEECGALVFRKRPLPKSQVSDLEPLLPTDGLSEQPRSAHDRFAFCFGVRDQTPKVVEFEIQQHVPEAGFVAIFINTFYSVLRFRSLWTMSECAGLHFVKFQRVSHHSDYVNVIGFDLIPPPNDRNYTFTRVQDPKWLAEKIGHTLREHCCRNLIFAGPFFGARSRSVKYSQEPFAQLLPNIAANKTSSDDENAAYGMLAYSRVALWRIVVTFFLYLGIGIVGCVILARVKGWDDVRTALGLIILILGTWVAHVRLAFVVVDRYDIKSPGS